MIIFYSDNDRMYIVWLMICILLVNSISAICVFHKLRKQFRNRLIIFPSVDKEEKTMYF